MAAFNRMRTYKVNVDAYCHAIISPDDNSVIIALPRDYIANLIAEGFMADITDTIGLTMTANARGWIMPGSNIVPGRVTA